MLVKCSYQVPDSTFSQNFDLLLLNLRTVQQGFFVGRKVNVWRFSEHCHWKAKLSALQANWPSLLDCNTLDRFISVVFVIRLPGKQSWSKMYCCVYIPLTQCAIEQVHLSFVKIGFLCSHSLSLHRQSARQGLHPLKCESFFFEGSSKVFYIPFGWWVNQSSSISSRWNVVFKRQLKSRLTSRAEKVNSVFMGWSRKLKRH